MQDPYTEDGTSYIIYRIAALLNGIESRNSLINKSQQIYPINHNQMIKNLQQ